jgi:hypothetical protein
MRKYGKKDANHNQISDVFTKHGLFVADTSAMGNGFPDMVISLGGITVMVEVKDGAKHPSQRRLTPDEQKFHSTWKGWIVIIESEDDALSLIAEIKHEQITRYHWIAGTA